MLIVLAIITSLFTNLVFADESTSINSTRCESVLTDLNNNPHRVLKTIRELGKRPGFKHLVPVAFRSGSGGRSRVSHPIQESSISRENSQPKVSISEHPEDRALRVYWKVDEKRTRIARDEVKDLLRQLSNRDDISLFDILPLYESLSILNQRGIFTRYPNPRTDFVRIYHVDSNKGQRRYYLELYKIVDAQQVSLFRLDIETLLNTHPAFQISFGSMYVKDNALNIPSVLDLSQGRISYHAVNTKNPNDLDVDALVKNFYEDFLRPRVEYFEVFSKQIAHLEHQHIQIEYNYMANIRDANMNLGMVVLGGIGYDTRDGLTIPTLGLTIANSDSKIANLRHFEIPIANFDDDIHSLTISDLWFEKNPSTDIVTMQIEVRNKNGKTRTYEFSYIDK